MFIGVLATALFALAQDSGREHFVTRRDGGNQSRRRDRDPQLRRFGFWADYPRSWRFLKGGAGTHESTSPEPCIDGSDRWVNMVDSKATDLLETRLKHLEIPHPKTNPFGSMDQVLQSPEFRQRVRLSHMLEWGSELGFQSMPKPGSQAEADAKAEREAESPLVLDNVTVRQALNELAVTVGAGVWIYDENGCQAVGRHSFRISFPVRSQIQNRRE